MSLGFVTALSVRASVEGQARKPGPRVRRVGWPSYPRQGQLGLNRVEWQAPPAPRYV